MRDSIDFAPRPANAIPLALHVHQWLPFTAGWFLVCFRKQREHPVGNFVVELYNVSLQIERRTIDRLKAELEAAKQDTKFPDLSDKNWVKGNEVLGKGAHGAVYFGMSTRTGELFACKQIMLTHQDGKADESDQVLIVACVSPRDLLVFVFVTHETYPTKCPLINYDNI